jgi:hypothetical protein
MEVRAPGTVIDAMPADTLVQGCDVEWTGIAWRYNDTIQPSAYRTADIVPLDCGPVTALGFYPTSASTIVLVLDRAPDPASVQANGDDFTSTGTALVITNAVADGRRVVLTTEAQTPGASYSFEIGAGITDYLGTAVTGAPLELGFLGYDSTKTLLISEVVDHPGAPNARYLELHNASDNDIALGGWQVRRYSNGAASPESFRLGDVLPAGDTLVLAQTAAGFMSVWPAVTPDHLEYAFFFGANGNDAYELYDGANVVDTYGVPGINGIGETWEFEDSVAARNVGVTEGSATWTAGEWTIVDVATTDTSTPGVR